MVRQNVIWLVFVFIGLAFTQAVAAQDPWPIPDGEKIKPIETQVEELFGEDIAKAKSSQARSDIADQLLSTATETDKPEECYVLLRRAQQLAVAAGNVDLAIRIVTEFTNRFQSDRSRVLGGVLTKLSESTKDAKQNKRLALKAETAAESAVRKDRVEQAKGYFEIAIKAAKKARDLETADRLSKRLEGLQGTMERTRRYKQASEKLTQEPDDEAANAFVGQYLCFVMNDWPKGLPLLEKGNVSSLKAVIELEKQSAENRADRMLRADAWWDAALANKDDPFVHVGCLRRSGSWFQAIASNGSLAGLTKLKVEKRLQVIRSKANRIPALENPQPRSTSPTTTINKTAGWGKRVTGMRLIRVINSLEGSKVTAVRFASDSKTIAASSSKKLALIDVARGTTIKSTRRDNYIASAIRFSEDGKQIITAGLEGDQSIRVFDAETLDVIQSRKIVTKWMKALAVSDKYILFGGEGSAATLLRTSSLTNERTWDSGSGWLFASAFSPNNDYMVTAGAGGAHVWEMEPGKLRHKLTGHSERVWSVAITPDGKRIATAAADKSIIIWDAATGEQQFKLEKHTGWPRQIDISPDGTALVSTGFDRRVCIWDLETGALIEESTKYHRNGIESVSCSPNGNLFVTADGQGIICLWSFDR